MLMAGDVPSEHPPFYPRLICSRNTAAVQFAIIYKGILMVWFYLFMTVIGVLYILIAVYEWTWIRKFETIPWKHFKWTTARIIYLITGIGGMGVGATGICSVILSSNSPILVIVGLASAYLFANTLFNYRNNQSIPELFRNNKA